jgi:peptidyl-prolyl cis-trans isomerase SurA
MRSMYVSRRLAGHMFLLALCAAFPLASATPAASQSPPAEPVEKTELVEGIAAVVNKDVITLHEVDEASKKAAENLAKQGIQVPDQRVLQRQVLQRLIMDRLIQQEIDRMGIRVSDAQLDQAINTIAMRNKITVDQMRKEIEKTGVAWDQYRESLRSEIRIDRLRQRTVDANIVVTDAEVDAYLKEQAHRSAVAAPQRPGSASSAAPVGTVRVALAQILVRIPEDASADQLAALHAKAEALLARVKKGEDFASVAAAVSEGSEALQGGMMGTRPLDGWPDLFVQAIATLKKGQISGILRSGNGFHILKVVDRAGGAQQAAAALTLSAPGSAAEDVPPLPPEPIQVTQTRARHILIKTSAVMSDEQARQRLEKLRLRLVVGGENFADLARQYSQDASAPQGGELNWLNPGETVPAFEAAMNALQVNEISQPVSTPFGWHLIQVQERRQHDISDEYKHMQARQELFERRAQPAFEDWLDQLRSQAHIENRLEQQDKQEKLDQAKG